MTASTTPWSLNINMPDGRTYDARQVAEHLQQQVRMYSSEWPPVGRQAEWVAHLQQAASIVFAAVSQHASRERGFGKRPDFAIDVLNTFLETLTDAGVMLADADAEAGKPFLQALDQVAIASIFQQAEKVIGVEDRHGVGPSGLRTRCCAAFKSGEALINALKAVKVCSME